MKICIYGAGAIGGWLGVRLAISGHEVSVVARGATLKSLQKGGLQLIDASGTRTVEVIASEDPAALGAQDVVIVAVKAPAMADVARQIHPLIDTSTTILTAMNGVPWWFCDGLGGYIDGQRLLSVDPDRAIAKAIPSVQTVGCVVHASCRTDAPGVVRHHLGNSLVVGEACGHASERVEALASMLVDAGFDTTASRHIQTDVWYKLWGNMTLNPVSALTGATTDKILQDPLAREFLTNVMLEAKEIGAHFGILIGQDPEDRHAVTLRLGAMKTSMLQDVEAKKFVELDALVTAVHDLGKIASVPTPFTNALLGLARVHARNLGLYSD